MFEAAKHIYSGIRESIATLPKRMTEDGHIRSAYNRAYKRAEMVLSERYAAAADMSRIRADWLTTTVSPTTLIEHELKVLIARSQQAVRTTPYGKSARNVYLDYIVGSGLQPFPAVKDESGTLMESLNAKLSEDWNRFNDQGIRTGNQPMTIYESQRMALGAMIDTGTCLTNILPSKDGSWLPIAFQVLNATRLDMSRDNYTEAGLGFVQDIKSVHGINLNKYGEPESFNILGFNKPISAELMNVFFVQNECEQYLGMPWFTPVLPFMHDLDELLKDRILASRLVEKIAWWIKKSSKSTLISAKDEDDFASFQSLSVLSTQDKPELLQSEDRVAETFAPLVRLYLHGIGAGLGFSHTLLTRDLQDVNFASTRFNKIADSVYFSMLRKSFSKGYCQYLYNEFVKYEILTGRVPGVAALYKKDPWRFQQCYWIGDGEQWVDPLKDAKAVEVEYANGWTTLEEICAKKNKNYKAVLKQRAVEYKMIESLGLKDELRPKQAQIDATAEAAQVAADTAQANSNSDGANANGN